MKCPACGGGLKVVDTINAVDNLIYRRKTCLDCGYKIKTVERVIEKSDEELMERFESAARRKRYGK